MVYVRQHLIVRVGVNCGHDAVFQSNLFMQRFDHRRQTVCRTRRIGNDRVFFLQYVVVDTVNDGRIDITACVDDAGS